MHLAITEYDQREGLHHIMVDDPLVSYPPPQSPRTRRGSLLGTIVDALTPVLIVAVTLALLVVVTRITGAAWVRLGQRGRLPVIVHETAFVGVSRTEEASENSAKAFATGLRSFIGEDVQQNPALVPGGSAVVTPSIPAQVPAYDTTWVTAVLRFAFAEGPAYHIYTAMAADDHLHRCWTQVVRRPGNRVISAFTLAAGSNSELVLNVGSYCVQRIQQEHSVLDGTPRWEHWAGRGGYREFRRALQLELGGELDSAITRYQSVGRLSIGNTTVSLRRASLYEQAGDYTRAVREYRLCHQLWPEHIEAAYRYAAAMNNSRKAEAYVEAVATFDGIRKSLARRRLVLRWLRASLPSRRNRGEREYWSSLLRPHILGKARYGVRHSRRRDLLVATDIAICVTQLVASLEAPESGPEAGPAAAVLLDTVNRILHRKRIGWLGHYNAACFFSQLLLVHPSRRPAMISGQTWVSDNALRACHELAVVVRNPVNQVDPQWMSSDPDLEPLRGQAELAEWCAYLGVAIDPSLESSTEGRTG